MGRWAQYRHRGRGHVDVSTAPSPSDWTWAYDAENVIGVFTWTGASNAGTFFQCNFAYDHVDVWSDNDGLPECIPANFGQEFVTAEDHVSLQGRIRLTDVLGNPLSDWSEVKSVDFP